MAKERDLVNPYEIVPHDLAQANVEFFLCVIVDLSIQVTDVFKPVFYDVYTNVLECEI